MVANQGFFIFTESLKSLYSRFMWQTYTGAINQPAELPGWRFMVTISARAF
jgi:hypothetical protein